jgi:SanA protein
MKTFKRIYKIIALVLLLAILYFIAVPFIIVQNGKHRIYTDVNKMPDYNIAIVFGAGLTEEGRPNSMLRDRLDSVANLYYDEKIGRILLSGDNSCAYYNEPQAMYEYLLYEHDIRAEDLVRDYAGLRTYDTCARAKNIWGVDKALLISQGYHLSRAIFTCQGLGIESTGYSATKYGYLGETYYKSREILALHKAFWDVYFSHPDYIRGRAELDFIE